MAITTSQVTVPAASPTPLFSTDPRRRRVYIKNVHSSKVYISGNSMLDETNSFHLDPDETLIIESTTASDCSARNEMYAYLDSGSDATVCVMEITD